MKEIELSFTIRILPKQTDVHWIEEELLRIRGEVFLGVLKRVLEEIEEEVLGVLRECEICGLGMVRNGQALRRVKTLLGVVGLEWVRMRCPRCGQEIYPLDEAIGVLDIWHLEKELRWALGEESLGFIEELKGLAF